MSSSYLTAISRRTLSSPAKFLSANGLIKGRVLDFGCGKGKDCEELEIEGYDPHYRPQKPIGKFDTIICTYVLNVIEDETDRAAILDEISSLLNDGGASYLSVRNDKKNLRGHTRRGTWQGYIDLDLPILKKTSSFVMYKLNHPK